uniref:BZIP domain-containing protein n=1 Tax=Strongyloides stercoralis TaxID=6248 RepID=A0A0K0E8C2_STRER
MDVSDGRINFNDHNLPPEVEDIGESYNFNQENSPTFLGNSNEIFNDNFSSHMYTNILEDDHIVNSFENFEEGVCSPSMNINLSPLPMEYEEKNLSYYLNQPNVEILSSNITPPLYDNQKNIDEKVVDNHHNATIKLKKKVEIVDTISENQMYCLGKGNQKINKSKYERKKLIGYNGKNIEESEKLLISSNSSNNKSSNNNKFPPLILTDEEKKLCLKEGVHFPEYYPLTKNEEKELKRIRRKIRNKKSAQESRKRKQDYIKALEEKVCKCEYENKHLKYKLECSSNENKNIIVQLRKLQFEVNKNTTNENNLSTSLIIAILSIYFFVNHLFLSISKNRIGRNGSVLNNNSKRSSQTSIDLDCPTPIVDLSRGGLLSLPDEIGNVSHQIKHLILDGNNLNEYSFNNYYFPNLESLSLNSNNIKNVGILLQILKRQTPNLTFISLIENPGWPHPITYFKNVHLYKKYCKAIVSFFPKLMFVDSVKVYK